MNTCDLCGRDEVPSDRLLCTVCREAVSRAVNTAQSIARDEARRDLYLEVKIREIEQTRRVGSAE